MDGLSKQSIKTITQKGAGGMEGSTQLTLPDFTLCHLSESQPLFGVDIQLTRVYIILFFHEVEMPSLPSEKCSGGLSETGHFQS
jgi:hypothetical protein